MVTYECQILLLSTFLVSLINSLVSHSSQAHSQAQAQAHGRARAHAHAHTHTRAHVHTRHTFAVALALALVAAFSAFQPQLYREVQIRSL